MPGGLSPVFDVIFVVASIVNEPSRYIEAEDHAGNSKLNLFAPTITTYNIYNKIIPVSIDLTLTSALGVEYVMFYRLIPVVGRQFAKYFGAQFCCIESARFDQNRLHN